jgi:hypothetical protein
MFDGFLPPLAEAEVIQLGFVVADRAQAMAEWTRAFGAGPWFTVDNFAGDAPVYRGAPAPARFDIALGFAGAMQIELIAACDTFPSVYSAMFDAGRYGFHHFGIAAPDFEAAAAREAQRGHELVFTARVPGGGRVAYFDTQSALPGMIELIETVGSLRTSFAEMRNASLGWTGAPLSIPLQPRD